MKSLIKFENLSSDIKEEIENFHELLIIENKKQTIESTMEKWFDKKFDDWLLAKYCARSDTKRKHFRINIELPLRILDTVLDAPGDDPDAINLIGNVINISRGGMYFKYFKPIEISSIIKVVLDLNQAGHDMDNIEALAMVMRVDNLENGEIGIGVMFSSIYDTHKYNLNLLLLKSLSEYIYPANKERRRKR